MTHDFPVFVLAGFVAQLVDGALGMAYGVSATSLLVFFGVPPAVACTTVHAAECVTTAASGISHHAFGNVDRRLFRYLVVPGVLGAIAGALVLAHLPGERVRPFVAAYLGVMGVVILVKAFASIPPRAAHKVLFPLGFVGAFLDAVGGGGWGPIVTSTLIARGHDHKKTIGSVNAAEFFVSFASTMTFIATLGVTTWKIAAGLALGGVLAAPLGAFAVKHVPRRPAMIAVGLLVVILSSITLFR